MNGARDSVLASFKVAQRPGTDRRGRPPPRLRRRPVRGRRRGGAGRRPDRRAVYARNPPVHERRRPSYGCVVLPVRDLPTGGPEGVDIVELVDEGAHESARELADGLRTFVVRASQGGAALAYMSAADDTLVHQATDINAWIVQRHPNGIVRVFGRERLFVFDNDEWAVKPYGHTRWLQLAHAIGADAAQLTVGMALLDLCLHVLSARRIGATFVWMVRGGGEALDAHLQKQARQIAAPLNVRDAQLFEPLVTLLASVDGACIIDEAGSVVGVKEFPYRCPTRQSGVSNRAAVQGILLRPDFHSTCLGQSCSWLAPTALLRSSVTAPTPCTSMQTCLTPPRYVQDRISRARHRSRIDAPHVTTAVSR